jgi:hypothetical protein
MNLAEQSKKKKKKKNVFFIFVNLRAVFGLKGLGWGGMAKDIIPSGTWQSLKEKLSCFVVKKFRVASNFFLGDQKKIFDAIRQSRVAKKSFFPLHATTPDIESCDR